MFAAYETVETIPIIKDRDTGPLPGIAFIEMTRATEARGARTKLARSFIEIQCTIRGAEIIGATGC